MRSKLIIFLTTLLLLTACAYNLDDSLEKARDNSEKVFSQETTLEVNNELDDIDLYLPKASKITKSTDNNIVFENKKIQL